MILDPYACISDAGFFPDQRTNGQTDERTDKPILGVGWEGTHVPRRPCLICAGHMLNPKLPLFSDNFNSPWEDILSQLGVVLDYPEASHVYCTIFCYLIGKLMM